MSVKDPPLVSCVMPTYNRRRFIPNAIEYFLRQDYINKELIIIDDGTDTVEDLIPDHPLIRYYSLSKKITLGAKLNLACSYAQGEIIANWDDDDWYSKTRLTYQVDALKNDKIELCGINNLLYYDLKNNRGYRYIYPAGQRTWLLGSSLCYKKKLWNRNRFADIDVGMDGLFVWATSSECVKVLSDSTMSVHMIHEANVSPKKTNGAWWHNYPVDELKKIMKEDRLSYMNGDSTSHVKAPVHQNISEPLKNIYACLVHENEECVTDLVRNLHYHDPSSVILLFNGGNNSSLFTGRFPYDKFGAVIHPASFRVKYGYLHTFALSCMEFALENLTFNSLTIVDSDQLAIRSGYSAYVGDFFKTTADVGLLSSNPEKINKDNVSNQVAAQAFKEYDLWRPLLNSFQDGESNFVYWTFWPSTVFTRDAIKDLISLFKKSKQLQEIMKHTKIWASEEVILPTLVKLLGYKIVANPCSYDYVSYRKKYSLQDINNALGKANAYWIHPIDRIYDTNLRKYIRDYFSNYPENNKANDLHVIAPDKAFISSLIKRIKEIEGWLTDAEANLLIKLTERACKELPLPWNIVEIGSYHGKSTVLFGSIVKKFFGSTRIYAIDPHDGKLGDADRGLQSFPPSFNKFKKNIEDSGLTEFVEIIKDNSCNIKWDKPVSLLFIDGLHDYANVATDFGHFADWIPSKGYVAFHDYAAYFPGVKKLVDELLGTKSYEKVDSIDSLIILKKHN